MYTIQALSKGDIHSIPVDSMEALFDYFDCNFDDLFQREKKKSRGNDSPALAAA
jgi:DNA-binding Xre family transcriptional regulator